jgi:hypothetical protein
MLPSPATKRSKSKNLAPRPSATELRSPARAAIRARVNPLDQRNRRRGAPNRHFETPQEQFSAKSFIDGDARAISQHARYASVAATAPPQTGTYQGRP